MIDLDALKRDLEAAGCHVIVETRGTRLIVDGLTGIYDVCRDGTVESDDATSLTSTEIAIIARHVAPQPSPDRAELVDQLATEIVDAEAAINDGNPVLLAQRLVAWFEAAGGWPRPETIMPEEIDEIARWFTLPLNLTDDARNLVVREILAALPDRHRRLVLGVQGE